MKNWLAQEGFTVSPVSVGMSPSNRTLDSGEKQVDVAFRFSVTSEQRPVADDPLAASVPTVGMVNCVGTIGVSGWNKSQCKSWLL